MLFKWGKYQGIQPDLPLQSPNFFLPPTIHLEALENVPPKHIPIFPLHSFAPATTLIQATIIPMPLMMMIMTVIVIMMAVVMIMVMATVVVVMMVMKVIMVMVMMVQSLNGFNAF